MAEHKCEPYAMGIQDGSLPRIGSLDGRSNNSSSTDITQLSLEEQRTHHLLKHSLSNGQRVDALMQFGTQDVKDAAKEISRMGQRELQSKFKLVYGAATHSNNNDWLRRKLYEAIGAAPIKAATKTKARKPAPKPKKPLASELMFHTSSSALSALERRSKRATRGTPKGVALAEMLKRTRVGGSLPSSPVAGRSVLDVHRYLAHDATTSTSEDDEEAGAWRHLQRGQVAALGRGGSGSDSADEEQDEEEPPARRHNNGSQHAAAVAAALAEQRLHGGGRRHGGAAPGPLPTAFGSLPAPGLAMRGAESLPAGGLPALRRSSSAGLPSASSFNLDMLQGAGDAWGTDAWADAALNAAAARQPAAVGVGLLPEEDDDLLLPMMEMSAFELPGGSCPML